MVLIITLLPTCPNRRNSHYANESIDEINRKRLLVQYTASQVDRLKKQRKTWGGLERQSQLFEGSAEKPPKLPKAETR
jgi:hypothetical protein